MRDHNGTDRELAVEVGVHFVADARVVADAARGDVRRRGTRATGAFQSSSTSSSTVNCAAPA